MRISMNQSVDNQKSFSMNKAMMNGFGKRDELSGIRKQIRFVQEQLAELQSDETISPNEKSDKQKTLSEQLKELNKQLLERTLEIQQKEREKQQEEAATLYGNEDDDLGISNMQNFISMGNSLRFLSHHNSSRTKMKGEARVLESEIKLDELRGLDVLDKKAELAKINSKIENLTYKIEDTAGKLNKEIKKDKKPGNDKIDIEEDEERDVQGETITTDESNIEVEK